MLSPITSLGSRLASKPSFVMVSIAAEPYGASFGAAMASFVKLPFFKTSP